MMTKRRYDLFKDTSFIHERDLGRPDLLAGVDSFHPARREEEEGLQPCPPIPGRRPGERLNWQVVAQHLAQGLSVESTASLQLCDPQRIWRNLRRSARFRARIAQAADRLRLQADLRFRDLHVHAALQMRHRANSLDPKTLQWLAERLRLGEAPAGPAELGNWLEAVASLPGTSRRKSSAKQETGNGTQSA
jgi:hypothetical protein